MESTMTEEKGHKFRIRVRPTRWNHLGLLFSLIGFVLVFLCLIGGWTRSSQELYFVKVTGFNFTATFGLLGYCTTTTQLEWNCQLDEAVKMMPFMITVPSILNETYPSLFTDRVMLDDAVYPTTVAQPSHDPRIFAACLLCLICSAAAVAIGLAKILFYTHVQDGSYLRGFCALMAAVVALLLVAESTIMYQSGIDSLNMIYPHLQASAGPGMTLMGIALTVFFLSGLAYMNGCLIRDTSEEGYEPL